MRGLIGLTAVLGIILFSLSIVTAACGTNGQDDSQLIMRLSSQENAHGALWNGEYGTKICYDEVFSGNKFMGASPHECTSDSSILKLYSQTNSHATTKDYTFPDSTSYPNTVCYKGVTNCTVWQGQGCTKYNQRVIVYLSSLGNAHLSRIYQNGFYAICCANTTGMIGPTYNYCRDYPTEGECNNYATEAAQNGCPAGKACFCAWNITGTGICEQRYHGITPDCEYNCTMSPTNYLTAECKENGYKTVSISAQIVPSPPTCAVSDPDCVSKDVEIKCGLVGLDLPFFGFWQFAAGLVAIAVVYLFARKRT
jgi:hypothetical protein